MPFVMQARSSVSGAIVTWVRDYADWTGDEFPGPGTASQLAITAPGPNEGDDDILFVRTHEDTLAISDLVEGVIDTTLFRTVDDDAIDVLDEVEVLRLYEREINDTIDVTDLLDNLSDDERMIEDSVSILDALLVNDTHDRTFEDSVAVDDATLANDTHDRTNEDTIDVDSDDVLSELT